MTLKQVKNEENTQGFVLVGFLSSRSKSSYQHIPRPVCLTDIRQVASPVSCVVYCSAISISSQFDLKLMALYLTAISDPFPIVSVYLAHTTVSASSSYHFHTVLFLVDAAIILSVRLSVCHTCNL